MVHSIREWQSGALGLLFLMLLPVFCWGQDSAPGKGVANVAPPKVLQSDSPLKIASDRMEVNQADKTVLFEGHVVVKQDDLTITGKRLKVFSAADPKGPPSQSAMVDKIDRIEVEGDVTISQKDKVATAERAVYYHQEQKIVLTGQPIVAQGEDRIQGRLITLLLAQGKSIVEGGAETPVQAVLHPARKD
jgi:lipopolysaccharide export system protein LptA